jgi:hypothetical protein
VRDERALAVGGRGNGVLGRGERDEEGVTFPVDDHASMRQERLLQQRAVL